MLDFNVDQNSVTSTVDYMQAVKDKILAAVRVGMQEGMELLAGNTVAAMAASGIQNRTGALEAGILNSPRVTEDENVIRGRVMAKSLVKAKGGALYYNNLGNILDMGFTDPAVSNEPMHQIVAAGGDTFWARGHVAFDVKPHSFFRRAVRISESPIMDLIRSRVSEACSG